MISDMVSLKKALNEIPDEKLEGLGVAINEDGELEVLFWGNDEYDDPEAEGYEFFEKLKKDYPTAEHILRYFENLGIIQRKVLDDVEFITEEPINSEEIKDE